MRLDVEWLSEVARLMPEILAAHPEVRSAGPLTQRWQRQRLFESLARAILATKRPLILLIDDLQWCDHDSLEWLHYLLRSETHVGLLIVGTVRVEEVGVNHPLNNVLHALRREGRMSEISLDPLSLEETVELAGHTAGHVLSKEQAARMYQETEGNPLFIIETVQAGLEFMESRGSTNPPVTELANGESAESGAMLLPVVKAVLARRLSQVTPSARQLLDVAAVLGRSFTFDILAQVADTDENTLVRGLDELWQRRIVREQGPDAYDFTHEKLRAAAYMALSTARRRVLHRRVAEALEAAPNIDREAASAQIATHYKQAGKHTLAVSWYCKAAETARQLYANADALAYYRRALALLTDRTTQETAYLYSQIGDVLHLLGQYDEARDAWEHALHRMPEHNRIGRADLQRRLGNLWRDQYHHDHAMRMYDAAESMLNLMPSEADKAAWLCWIEINLERIMTHYWLGQAVEMLQIIGQIQPVIKQHGSLILQARPHQLSSIGLLRGSRYRASNAAIVHAKAYLSAIEQASAPDLLPAAHFQLGFVLLWADKLDAAEQEIQTALAFAERSGDISLEGRCLTYLTVIARKHGQLEQTRAYAERSLRVATAGNMLDYIGAAQGNLAWLAFRAGDLEQTRMHGAAALAAWSQLQASYMFEALARWPLIGVALAEKDAAEIRTHARALLDERQARLPEVLEQALEAVVGTADDGDWDAIYAQLEPVIDLAREQGYL